jgi:4-hydroxybenzoate polyprenyltransferase
VQNFSKVVFSKVVFSKVVFSKVVFSKVVFSKVMTANPIGMLQAFSSDIKLGHSVFALPFVGVALTLTGLPGIPLEPILKIVVCMVFARSFAMGMNRYLDREFDGKNDRTKQRAIPAGAVTASAYLAITLACGAAFVAVAFSISRLAGSLAPELLVVLAFYSLMKRLSWLTHWYLGMCLGLAPIATEIALFDRVSWPVALVGAAVAFWTAGFDLLYSLQDKEFDQSNNLHSAPSRLGHQAAIWLSRASFVLMLAALGLAGVLAGAGSWWNVGIGVVAAILFTEHWLIRGAMMTGKSDKINLAFFNLNALVSMIFFSFAMVNAYAQ